MPMNAPLIQNERDGLLAFLEHQRQAVAMPPTDCGRIKPASNRLRVHSPSADSSSISLRENAIGAIT